MGISTCGALKREITAKEIFDFVLANFDQGAKLEQNSTNSHYINLNYLGETRSLHIYYGNDYREETDGYSANNEITEIIVNKWGHAEQIIEPIVRYFGGWYIADDCISNREEHVVFYEFNSDPDIIITTPIERYVFDKLIEDKDWKSKIKLAQFIKDNLDEIKTFKG